MSFPVFLSKSTQLQANWREAFEDAQLITGLPDKFDMFASSPIFVDFMGLATQERQTWLSCAISTGRPVIVLSPVPNDQEALAAIKAGAVGYGHTLSVAPLLKQMISVTQKGGLWLGRHLMKKLLHGVDQLAEAPKLNREPESTNRVQTSIEALRARFKEMSEREAQVAHHVALGSTNLEISEALEVKERTVKAHITSMFKKLNVRNRVELALLLHNIKVAENRITPHKIPQKNSL